MQPRARWIAHTPASAEYLDALAPAVSPLIAQLLWNRDLTDPQQALAFLASDWSQLHDPMLLRDMDRAVARIRRACAEHERVAVYGDFDTDGVTGVTLLFQALTGLGLDVLPYIPKRLEEGYGLNTAAVERLAMEVQLLITVDCGISNVKEIARAQALGLDVIVLDHHEPPAELPDGYALINPKQPGCNYPYKMLVGVGVAYKLVQALHRAGMHMPFRSQELLDVVALGTVTDMGPLHGENRVLVKYGLKYLNTTKRVGLRALIDVAGIKGPVDAQNIGFGLGPRINAAGRLDDANRAYELLTCTNVAAAQTMAAELNTLNIERQALTKQVQQVAQALVTSSGKHNDRILILDGKDFPAGIVGLVAARLVEAFGRPVLLLERGETTSRGSARSISGFSIVDAFAECADVFDKYGGHAMAAGFSIQTARLPELERNLKLVAERLITDDLLVPRIHYDAELNLNQVSYDLITQLAQLEPFGQGNAQPVWVSRGVQVVDTRTMGTDQQHLKLRVREGRSDIIEVVAWRQGHRQAEFRNAGQLDLAYTMEDNEWQGRHRVQLVLKDAQTSS
ncbi:MAG: single-stranded-DNA-specific exonuclease RecJ [Herpetosiphonaceae bacterium]|nr:single-stranded-DNA-specific exonuclease RecJ [Herpetosiphonaceae bacterium]